MTPGAIQVSGDVPTLPSLGPKVWLGAGVGSGLGLREGRVGTSPETWIDPLSLGFWLELVKLSSKGGVDGYVPRILDQCLWLLYLLDAWARTGWMTVDYSKSLTCRLIAPGILLCFLVGQWDVLPMLIVGWTQALLQATFRAVVCEVLHSAVVLSCEVSAELYMCLLRAWTYRQMQILLSTRSNNCSSGHNGEGRQGMPSVYTTNLIFTVRWTVNWEYIQSTR